MRNSELHCCLVVLIRCWYNEWRRSLRKKRRKKKQVAAGRAVAENCSKGRGSVARERERRRKKTFPTLFLSPSLRCCLTPQEQICPRRRSRCSVVVVFLKEELKGVLDEEKLDFSSFYFLP